MSIPTALNSLELHVQSKIFYIHNTEFLVAEACQMPHSGDNRIEESYESKK